MIQRRVKKKKKKTVIETNEGGEATGTGSANRGLQCIFLNREGCCCFDTTENGGIPDPRQLSVLVLCGSECRMCSASDAAGVI